MSVVAKMRLLRCTEHAGSSGNTGSREVVLNAVAGEENKPWSIWTPSGELRLCVNNPACFPHFKLGKTYLVTLTEIEEG